MTRTQLLHVAEDVVKAGGIAVVDTCPTTHKLAVHETIPTCKASAKGTCPVDVWYLPTHPITILHMETRRE